MQSQMTGFASKTILVEFSRHFKPASFEPKTQTVKLAIACCRSGDIWALKAWLNQLIIRHVQVNCLLFGNTVYSITHSISHYRLKTFLFCKSFPPQPFLFFFRTVCVDSPDCLLLLLSMSVFTF